MRPAASASLVLTSPRRSATASQQSTLVMPLSVVEMPTPGKAAAAGMWTM
ncbi:MAG: hypothetical protein ABJA74_10770 [Lapillicoccus sp.]